MGLMQTINEVDANIVPKLEKTSEKLISAREAVGEVIFGQDKVIDQTLIAILSGGHALIIGVPGLAKTKLVETMGTVLGLDEKRIQFTPDLMPADIVGSEVLEETADKKRAFRFIKGPIFSQLLMADEINRASPRTQSALLQAMQEHHVTVAGETYPLPRPFHVLATQNPLEQEGTYPLPEAQLDRFILEIDITYPDLDAERRMLFATTGATEILAKKALSTQDLISAQNLIRQMPVGDAIVEAILKLVRGARPDEPNASAEIKKHVAWGPGPRASQALMLGVRAKCLLEGRLSPSIDDVLALARPVLKHRMALTFAARADGVRLSNIVDHLCDGIS